MGPKFESPLTWLIYLYFGIYEAQGNHNQISAKDRQEIKRKESKHSIIESH